MKSISLKKILLATTAVAAFAVGVSDSFASETPYELARKARLGVNKDINRVDAFGSLNDAGFEVIEGQILNLPVNTNDQVALLVAAGRLAGTRNAGEDVEESLEETSGILFDDNEATTIAQKVDAAHASLGGGVSVVQGLLDALTITGGPANVGPLSDDLEAIQDLVTDPAHINPLLADLNQIKADLDPTQSIALGLAQAIDLIGNTGATNVNATLIDLRDAIDDDEDSIKTALDSLNTEEIEGTLNLTNLKADWAILEGIDATLVNGVPDPRIAGQAPESAKELMRAQLTLIFNAVRLNATHLGGGHDLVLNNQANAPTTAAALTLENLVHNLATRHLQVL